MAGILFTDGNMCLGGFNHRKFYITGLGGKAKEKELSMVTATREVLEELFELKEPIDKVISDVYAELVFDKVMITGSYTIYVMNFNDLTKIMKIVSDGGYSSNVYDKLPTTLVELLVSRKPYEDAEFSHLSLLPCAYNIGLDQNFVHDIYGFKNCQDIM
jgi:hypothetical protein